MLTSGRFYITALERSPGNGVRTNPCGLGGCTKRHRQPQDPCLLADVFCLRTEAEIARTMSEAGIGTFSVLAFYFQRKFPIYRSLKLSLSILVVVRIIVLQDFGRFATLSIL